jgi:signal transduction histidine kinase
MKKKLGKILISLRKWATSKLILSLGISIAVTAITLNLNLFRVEAFLYDARIRMKGEEGPHPDIALLVLGEKEGESPSNAWGSIEAHHKALQNLVAQEPKAIVYLNRFDAAEIESNPHIAEKFVSTANQAEKNGTKIYFGTDVDLGGEVLPAYPLSLLAHSPSILHKDGAIFGEDKVMRRGLLTVFNEPSIHVRLAYPDLNREQLLEKVKDVRGAYFFKPADSWHVLIRFPHSTASKENLFPKVYFSDALQNKNLSSLKGKIVLVETMRKDSMNDYAFTPYSRITYTHPRIVVHAALLDTLLKDSGTIILSKKLDVALTFFLSIMLTFVTISMSPGRGVAAMILMSAGLFVVSLALFKFGFWLRLVHPLFAMFFTYYLIVPYRAILEYKKRWEVQEKHDLLVQVEEMKGNFLSLMSHDLKTPVARIQGLAELVLRQGNLGKEQTDEVKEIIASTENLDKFISKILNLTKVESNEIKLNKRSKDINKILEQCVQKLQFQAKSKDIVVDLKLDPLFPIQVDAALIIQVFTNIIDNAIKYSPPGSKIEIHSGEVGDFVEVIVKDSGPGMDEEERRQLFTKFFRGKSSIAEQSKGSGLGLYLSKYFIELHRGRIETLTEKGSGSKFVIQLPIQGEA